MRISTKLPAGIRRLFRLRAGYASHMRDLDEEIAFHIETHVDKLRARGMSETEARTAALLRFGDSRDLREFCGEIVARREPRRRIRQWFEELEQDVRFAWRQVTRAPGFTATIVMILALGIGANAGVFSVVHHTLIAPLPFKDGNRMVTIYSTSGGGKITITPSEALIEAWRRNSQRLERSLTFDDMQFVLGDTTGDATPKLSGAAIPPEAFSFIGVVPVIGRPILASDTTADAPPVVVLGEGLWKREFGAATDILGTTVALNGIPHVVIGVVPSRFFMPFTDSRDAFVARRHGSPGRPTAIAILRSGVEIDAVNREAASLFPPNSELNSYGDPPRIVRQLDLVGARSKQMIFLLFGSVGMVLLIACANAGNLLLARAWSRQREFAVRRALGAGRRRIVRQVLTESLLVAVVAGGIGIGIATLILAGLRAAVPVDTIDLSTARIEMPVLLWNAAVSLLTGTLFGMIPALSAASARVNDSLKSSGRGAAGSRTGRNFRFALVIGELGLSVVLLVGAGLLVRTLFALDRVDYGFNPHGLSNSYVTLRAETLTDPVARRSAMAVALQNVKAIPGVRDAIFTSGVAPNFSIGMGGVEVQGRVTGASDSLKTLAVGAASPEYFAFAGIPLESGRNFSSITVVRDRDDVNEIIVNRALAKRLWPNGDALGARVRRGESAWGTVVGIVGDVVIPGNEERTRRLNTNLQLYTRMALAPTEADLSVRSNVSLSTLMPAIKAAIRNASPGIRSMETKLVDAELRKKSAPQRFVLTLIGAFSIVAVLLAVVGLHGVVSYALKQRTREIGVRVALGALPGDITRLALAEGVLLALSGVVLGAAGALAATRTLRSFLYGVEPGDPATFAVVSIALLAIAVGAAYAPARRAARVDPVQALRAE